jgi:hypothetical protein
MSDLDRLESMDIKKKTKELISIFLDCGFSEGKCSLEHFIPFIVICQEEGMTSEEDGLSAIHAYEQLYYSLKAN